MAACLSWTSSANLPLSFVERIYQTYVHPSVTFGLELIPAGPQLAGFQKRILQWGRRLLGWPQGSPSLVVQGQLAWPDASTIRLSRAAGLWARLLSLPRGCLAGHVARLPTTFVPHPAVWGIHSGCAQGLVKRWLGHARQILSDRFRANYVFGLQQASESLHPYLIWQPVPRLHPVVYGHNIHAHHARYWALARCGHHDFADGRSARHRNTCLSTPCRFCSLGCDSLEHALLQCPAHTLARNRWHQRSRGGRCLSFHILFSTESAVNTARNILNNIAFVGHVCQAAVACEI